MAKLRDKKATGQQTKKDKVSTCLNLPRQPSCHPTTIVSTLPSQFTVGYPSKYRGKIYHSRKRKSQGLTRKGLLAARFTRINGDVKDVHHNIANEHGQHHRMSSARCWTINDEGCAALSNRRTSRSPTPIAANKVSQRSTISRTAKDVPNPPPV